MEQEDPGLQWFLAKLEQQWPGFRGGDETTRNVAALVWNQLGGACDVGSIVAQLPGTRRTIERLFRRQLNCSISEVTAFARLELAKWLLIETSLPIHKIASKAGYSSSDWLGKVMRRETGLTPSEFRRAVQIERDSETF